MAKGSSKSKQKLRFALEPKQLMRLGIFVVGAIIVLGLLIIGARWLRGVEPVASFVATYPGVSPLPDNAPVGIPAWMGWQHFLNAFFMLLIIRTGWLVRTTQKPKGHWTRSNKGFLKTKKPPKKISMNLWIHYLFDALWVLNGIVFFVLLIVTGQWMRIVPTTWEIFPHALSAGIQYLSMDWPVENGWVNYNGLQVLSYFLTVFVAAPLALVSGLRMSNLWPEESPINKYYPAPIARAIHFPVMLYFVFFIVTHVIMVFSTSVVHGHGLFGNISHMYAAAPDVPMRGFIFFSISIVLMTAGWVLARPVFLAPLANLFGKVSR